MKLVFIHSHKFRFINGKFYSLGGLSDEVFERYSKYVDEIIVVARVIPEEKGNAKYSQIKNPKVQIKNIKDIKIQGLKQIIKDTDCVIARIPSFLSYIGIAFAKKYRKDYLLEVVGCAFDSLWNHGILGKIIAPFMLFIMKVIVRKAKYVLYVSQEFLQKRYPTKGKSIGCSDVVIENAEQNIFEKRIEKIKNTDKTKLILGTIAAVNVKYKGQQYVIEAIKDLKKKGIQIEYQLVGSGDNAYLENIVRKYGVEKNIIFLGSLPHEKIFEWIDNIDVYIQPSNTEGLCRSLAEAMSRACPCIASNAGGNVELVEKPYIFKKKKVMDIENKILELNQEKMVEMAEKSYTRAQNYKDEILRKRRDDFYKNFIMSTNKEAYDEESFTDSKSDE